jgi:hypothetical protein
VNGIDLQWKLAGPENIFAAVANISQYMVVVGQQVERIPARYWPSEW